MMEVILILKFRQKMIKRHVFLENFKDSWLSHRSLRGEGFVSILTELGSVSYSCLVIRGAQLSIDIASLLHRAWTRYWARGWWNLFVPSWFASPHQHHSACAQRYQIATISIWQKNKTSTAPKKTSSPLRQKNKNQNPKPKKHQHNKNPKNRRWAVTIARQKNNNN